jgi:L-amino acid N-acyltransferase YncA
MSEADWTDVAAIYQEGIDSGDATFASTPPASWEDWCAGKIEAGSIVAHRDGRILGWAALSPISNRKVYTGAAEVSVYVSQAVQRQGIGSRLLGALIEVSEANGIWTLQAGIFPENQASLHLHFKHGFRVVGKREKLGRMDFGPRQGEWRDVLLLERRSKVVGV